MKNNKGITLIALVITIIVMLILVAVTISMAVNGGLFDYAGKAVGDTQNALNQEQQLINDIIDEYIKPNLPETEGGEDVIVGVDGEIFSALYTSTQDYTDTNGDTAVIPKGFSVGTSDGINTIAGGLVIQDKDGNQFVWIPVEVKETDTETSIASFYRSQWSNNARSVTMMDSTAWVEPYQSGYEGEIAEYNAMVKSVYDNEGFYIGRFEAGSTTPRMPNTANGTTPMVVKRDAYPYNYVGWGATMSDYTSEITYNSLNQGLGALALSKAMYANKDVGVTSTLCYAIQWNAVLDFVKDDEHNVTNSLSWGNYMDSGWTITRTNAKYNKFNSGDNTFDGWLPVGESGITQEPTDWSDWENISFDVRLLTTGASDGFSSNNIFDVAGNVNEWTHESFTRYPLGNDNRHQYGGYFLSQDPAWQWVDVDVEICESYTGFRPVLYIK